MIARILLAAAFAFAPVALLTVMPNVLLVHPKVNAGSVKDLTALAKAHPDRRNYASQGSGTSGHLTAELLKAMAGIKIVHVPFKGAAPALTDLIAGQVDMMFVTLTASRARSRHGTSP